MKKLAQILRKQEFFPGFVGLFTNPTYFARKGLLENIRYFSPQIRGRLLDVGCGTKPYKQLFKDTEYVGLEIDTPQNRANKNADLFYNGNEFPCEDSEFDSVITSQVLEHVFNPKEFLKEIRRVLKNNGTLLLTVPFLWEEHEQPFDYGRYSSFGIAHLIKESGFEIIEQRKSVTGWKVISQITNSYIRRKFRVKNRKLRLLINAVLFGFVNITGVLLAYILPDHRDLYLDNIIFAKKTNAT